MENLGFKFQNFRDASGQKYFKPMIVITFPDGSTEVLEDAVRVDTRNFHEGMYDFYDIRGNRLKQIEMGSAITWETIFRGLQ